MFCARPGQPLLSYPSRLHSLAPARNAAHTCWLAGLLGMRIAIEYGQIPPLSCNECTIARHTICRPTTEDAPQDVCALRRDIITVAAGRTFLHNGEVPKNISILYSGWAVGYRQLRDGRRQIISFFLPGDTLVLEALCFPEYSIPYSVKALTEISTCTFKVYDIIALAHSTVAQRRELSRARHRYMTYLHERLFDLGRRSALGRLAQLLLEIRHRSDERDLVAADGSFNFPVRQEHLADALGLTTAYVNRTIAQLRRDGIISIMQDRVTINDEAELRRIAEEE